MRAGILKPAGADLRVGPSRKSGRTHRCAPTMQTPLKEDNHT